VIESGPVPFTKGFVPVAKVEMLTVGSAWADAPIAKKTMLPHKVLLMIVMVSLHVIDGERRRLLAVRSFLTGSRHRGLRC
jgi:hypothetical protein